MIDSHCHLAGEEFEADLTEVVDRARAAGVSGALVILAAADEAEQRRACRVASLWPSARFAVGIHPHQAAGHAADLDARLAALGEALDRHRAVALGEIGLDYHYDFAPRAVQQEVFSRQLRLARERGLPVILHTREAAADTLDILRRDAAGLRIVFHCFTGTTAEAARALELGAWVSLAGIVTFPKAEELRAVGRMVPADRLLVETDSPYLAPVPYRGKRNEPAFVARIVETLAGVRGESPARVAELTVANFEAVFGPGRGAAA